MKRSGFKRKKSHKKLGKSKTPRAKLISACDDMWSKLVKIRDSYCPWCTKKGKHRKSRSAHHIFSRRYMVTRHDLDNGIGLCGGCHMDAHQYPEEFRDFMIWYMPDKYLELKKLAQKGIKITIPDLEETKEYLERYLS